MNNQKVRPGNNARTSRKRFKAEERRSQLLRIAKELFSTYGFENISTKSGLIQGESECEKIQQLF
jgi:hypothetical protein